MVGLFLGPLFGFLFKPLLSDLDGVRLWFHSFSDPIAVFPPSSPIFVISSADMSRSGDITWEHCIKVDSTRKVQCTYYGKVMSGGVTRMKQHLGGIVGEVIACDKVPPQVKLYFKDLVEKGKGKKKAKLEQKGVRSGPTDEALDKEMKIVIRLSRQAAMEERRREMMRSGPGNGSRSNIGFLRRSNSAREQARIDRREKILRKEDEKEFLMA